MPSTCGKNQHCDSIGDCTNGCASDDKFGTKCNKICAEVIQNCSVCNATATTSCIIKCVLCKTGYHLDSDMCVSNNTCIPQCKDGLCDTDGNCITGWSSSDIYGPKCDKSCSTAFQHCTKCGANGGPVTCSACQSGYILHSGSCQVCPNNCNQGCVTGKDGITCKKDTHTAPDRTKTTEGTNTTIWIVVVIIAIMFVVVAAAVVVFACVRIRKLQAVVHGNQKTDVQLEAIDSSGQQPEHQTDTRHPEPETSNNPYSMF